MKALAGVVNHCGLLCGGPSLSILVLALPEGPTHPTGSASSPEISCLGQTMGSVWLLSTPPLTGFLLTALFLGTAGLPQCSLAARVLFLLLDTPQEAQTHPAC